MSKKAWRWRMKTRQWLIWLTIGEIAIFGWIFMHILYSSFPW